MAETKIQWCDAVWNPTTGCTKVSPGCAHCYAEGVAERFWAIQYPPIPMRPEDYHGQEPTERPREFTDVQTHADRLDQPLRWKTPRRIFVNSMSDLFHEDVPDAFIDQVFAVMALASRHTFQVLTKRAERMLAYLADGDTQERVELQLWERHTDDTTNAISRWPLLNVWLGCSVENQHFADERIPLLLQTPAAVRFVSYEPALGPVEFSPWLYSQAGKGIDWLIVGGESGRKARPFNLQWARDVISQCRMVGAAPFIKQFGAMPYEGTADPFTSGEGAKHCRLYDLDIDPRHGGNMSEWPEDLRVREFPVTPGVVRGATT